MTRRVRLLPRRLLRYAAAPALTLALSAPLALAAAPPPTVQQPPPPAAGATLAAREPAPCAPRPALVDPAAIEAARCLAARVDRWRERRRMGVGQQLNVSSAERTGPLDALAGRRVPVIGFDLEELDRAAHHEYPSDDAIVSELLTWAEQGAVLVATWHARNPHTGEPDSFDDRSWHDLGALLADTPEAASFWQSFDTMLGHLLRLQSGDDGAHAPAAVVLRPLHEANGGWFWWGHPDPAAYRRLWRLMQERAWAAGVHNVVWAYSANVVDDRSVRPTASLLPGGRVDLAGLDSYDPERGHPRDELSLAGWSDLARRVRRVALTEVGPYDATDGSTWRARIVTRTLRQRVARPAWAMFWFDDPPSSPAPRHERQIASLGGWRGWLDEECPAGLCRLR